MSRGRYGSLGLPGAALRRAVQEGRAYALTEREDRSASATSLDRLSALSSVEVAWPPGTPVTRFQIADDDAAAAGRIADELERRLPHESWATMFQVNGGWQSATLRIADCRAVLTDSLGESPDFWLWLRATDELLQCRFDGEVTIGPLPPQPAGATTGQASEAKDQHSAAPD